MSEGVCCKSVQSRAHSTRQGKKIGPFSELLTTLLGEGEEREGGRGDGEGEGGREDGERVRMREREMRMGGREG